jgi:hypothetical protein
VKSKELLMSLIKSLKASTKGIEMREKNKQELSKVLSDTAKLHKKLFGIDISPLEIEATLADILVTKRQDWIKGQLSDYPPEQLRAMRQITQKNIDIEPGQMALAETPVPHHQGAVIIENKKKRKKRKK